MSQATRILLALVGGLLIGFANIPASRAGREAARLAAALRAAPGRR